jgi:hypothetical protein
LKWSPVFKKNLTGFTHLIPTEKANETGNFVICNYHLYFSSSFLNRLGFYPDLFWGSSF